MSEVCHRHCHRHRHRIRHSHRCRRFHYHHTVVVVVVYNRIFGFRDLRMCTRILINCISMVGNWKKY